MSPIDPEYEKVLNFFYQNIESPTGIGVNEIRDHLPLSNERVSTVIKRLEVQEFITATPDPRGTLNTPAPNNFTLGKLYHITQRGIDRIKKQGEFKEHVPSISNQINNSPKAQIMANSLNGLQNIGNNYYSIISKLLKFIKWIIVRIGLN
ncbi:MAG: hypothetical protein ACRD8K_02700 [Nitrososphaeraceae archaeon]